MRKNLKNKDTEILIYLLIVGFPLYYILQFFQNYGETVWLVLKYLLFVLVFLLCCYVVFYIGYALFYIFMLVFEFFYYRSKSFEKIKSSIQENTFKCNELNEHIEELKNVPLFHKKIDYGIAEYSDESQYNYKRKELAKIDRCSNVYNCSLSVCKSAQEQPFKYLCKYFNIKSDEDTLADVENVFNDFSAAEQGKILLQQEREDILNGIKNKLPSFLLRYRKKKLIQKLGFEDIDFNDCYFPHYTFNYVSAGGNSAMSCDILLNLENLEKFILYLSRIIKFKKSIEGQRMLMTSSLREKIKKRDKYTCKYCGVSVKQEPNLLLEIDHIIPLSKGGITSEDNLQTLCWRCNRRKSNKIF